MCQIAALLLALCAARDAAAGFTASASASTAATYPWIDISASGTGLTLADDGISATLNLGFNFAVGSTWRTGLRVMSNGQVQFGGTDTSGTHVALPLDGSNGKPNIDMVMMPLWVDLQPGANQVRWALQGSAPNRVFIVSWLAVPFKANNTQTATFQVQIFEQGHIVYRYQAVAGAGSNALVGIEVSDTDFVQYARNTANSVPSGTTILWSPPVIPALYLKATGVPVGGFSATVPTGALANHDPGRDAFAGLLLAKGGSGVGESDSTKIQRWVSGSDGLTLSGTVELHLWSSMKDFATGKAGFLQANLRDCNVARTSCTSIQSASISRSPWNTSATWITHIISFGNQSRTISAGRVLELSVVVSSSSDDDMWLAYDSAAQPSRLAGVAATSAPASPARIRIEHASGSGLTCTPSTLTVRACATADCSSDYTSGAITGTLTSTGGSVAWPDGASFSIAAGSSTATVRVQSTTTTATVLGVASSSPAASSAATCNFGSPACTFTAADAGFVFTVADHVSEVAQTVSVSAVRKSDSSTACTPAFASTSKAVTFSCGYTNPGTGTLPVRVGGAALNSGNNAAAACDGTGRAVSLAFNANGVASTTVQYADVGQLLLSARYAGAANTSEAGLVMTGSDSFIAAPAHFTVSGITSGPIRAGSAFAATATARNSAGNTTPNFGRESSAETLYTGWTRIQPTGSGAVNGSFSGSFGGFTAGSASASNLAWTEVGRGDLVLRSFNANGYLGSGLLAYGSSAGQVVVCANEGASCVLPGNTTATVYFGERGSWAAKAGQTGTVACNNGNFGDPAPNVPKKCLYVATNATTGSVGDVIPHRFSVAASHACGAFSYAGQPIATTVTAQNAAGNTTVNFNGTATTTPAFAQAVTLADAAGLGTGTLSGHTIAASGFSAGVGSATPSYSFTSKTTAPQSLVLRATNGASGDNLISSQGYAEPTLPLRSGRLRLSNAFGRATAALQVPVAADYWSGSAWQLNSADNCTAVAAASVVLSNPRSATGAASTATSSAGAVAISNGNGLLTLAAPSPAGSTLSLDLALNLGSTGTDQSCNSVRPASTGAGLPWLRAQNGSCAATADRDPAARASFGIFAPETRKTVHVRDIY